MNAPATRPANRGTRLNRPLTLPVEPDEGPVLPGIAQDPEHDRIVDPGV